MNFALESLWESIFRNVVKLSKMVDSVIVVAVCCSYKMSTRNFSSVKLCELVDFEVVQ